jgi:signal transduction histidine kinase
MNEYLFFRLGSFPQPFALLALGNTAEKAEFCRRVSDNEGDLLGIGNLVGLLSPTIVRKRDEHEIRRLNAELEQKIVQLQEAQDELLRKEKLSILGQLSGSVGHELRNPLGVMSNAVYYLQMVLTGADETTKEYLGIIKKEIDNSLRIITDLLDFARTRAPQRKSVTSAELIRQSMERCTLPENVTVTVDVPETLPGLNVDPHQMVQVLINFITNGVQAMPGGGKLRIAGRFVGAGLVPAQSGSPQGVPRQNFVEISVTDTGGGITPENKKKLFQPLFTTKAKGIGLGLVVCRNLVETNGGRIEVESELGQGTTFTVILPVERAEG